LTPDQPWTLSSVAWEQLLTFLDANRDEAAAVYGELRVRLVGLFRWWGASDPDTLADQALDRAARRLQEGASVDRAAFGAYVRGIARMVFYESARQPQPVPLDREPVADGVTATDQASLDCLDRCLETLAAADRQLVLRYYDGANQITNRQQLARDMGISPTALRIRTHRLRARLEDCVAACLKRG
jgi:DNA-directed RNA polymerase specialized sigma24 family protein